MIAGISSGEASPTAATISARRGASTWEASGHGGGDFPSRRWVARSFISGVTLCQLSLISPTERTALPVAGSQSASKPMAAACPAVRAPRWKSQDWPSFLVSSGVSSPIKGRQSLMVSGSGRMEVGSSSSPSRWRRRLKMAARRLGDALARPLPRAERRCWGSAAAMDCERPRERFGKSSSPAFTASSINSVREESPTATAICLRMDSIPPDWASSQLMRPELVGLDPLHVLAEEFGVAGGELAGGVFPGAGELEDGADNTAGFSAASTSRVNSAWRAGSSDPASIDASSLA